MGVATALIEEALEDLVPELADDPRMARFCERAVLQRPLRNGATIELWRIAVALDAAEALLVSHPDAADGGRYRDRAGLLKRVREEKRRYRRSRAASSPRVV